MGKQTKKPTVNKPAVYKSIDTRLTPEEEKAKKIIDNFLNDIPQAAKLEMLARDGRMCTLKREYDDFIAHNNVLKASITKSLLARRKDEILFDFARRSLASLAASGEIGKYMEDEDHAQLAFLRCVNWLLMDALDSLYNDLAGLFRRCGFDTQFGPAVAIRNAREHIDKWSNATINPENTDHILELLDNDSDKVYQLARDRIAVLLRKVEREEKKKAKVADNNN